MGEWEWDYLSINSGMRGEETGCGGVVFIGTRADSDKDV
jgi:hypothetical protein